MYLDWNVDIVLKKICTETIRFFLYTIGDLSIIVNLID